MKLKNVIFINGTVAAVNSLIQKPLEIVEAYKVVKLAKILAEKEESFNKAKLKVFEKYGKLNEKDNTWKIDGEKNQKDAQVELDKILQIEEEYDYPSKAKVLEDVQISAAELMPLEDFVEIPKK